MDNSNWMLDDELFDTVDVAVGNFTAPDVTAFYLNTHGFNSSSYQSMQGNGSLLDASSSKEPGFQKCARSDSKTGPVPKARREKMRRDRMNDRFIELGSILEPGKPPRLDKAAILSDAIRMVTQLRIEAQKLKASNESLQEKIKELKAEKNDLRDEKHRLKTDKENLEQQIKRLHSAPSFVTHAPVIPASFVTQGQAGNQKLMMPFIGYPGIPMWQFMPPAAVDTSQDAESCPPVA